MRGVDERAYNRNILPPHLNPLPLAGARRLLALLIILAIVILL
jgi:hypothetical protein